MDIIQTSKVYVHRIFVDFVEPIRDRKNIAQIKNQLRGQRRYRDLLLFVVGINSALGISDLLELQVVHFLDDHQHIKRRFWIKEQKRGKRQEVVVIASVVVCELQRTHLDILSLFSRISSIDYSSPGLNASEYAILPQIT